MSLRNSGPISFSPSGVTNSIDGTNSPPGSMQSLSNLVPDPTTANIFIPRPAAELMTEFPGFSSPGFISEYHIIGSRIYGMIATALVPGCDQPFCYDASTDTFVTVGGTQDATTLPTSPATSGEWVPPIMELVGVLLIVTHPGFSGGGGAYFGWFDLSNPAAPTWNAGNTAPVALAAVPKSIAQFNGRGWFAVENGVVYTDVLLGTTVSLAAQALTLGDDEDVTALAGIPLSSALLGGVVQALIAFKSVTIMYQITGDATTSDLAVNALNVATGTLAPNTICQTPRGMAFISPQGLRLLDFNLKVSDPIGTAGSGISVPFIYAAEPSRMCAAYNADVLRISVENGIALGTPFQEWWCHFARGFAWTGPHTFPASYIHAFTHKGAGANHASFIMAPEGITGSLWDSHPVPDLVPVYVENGDQMSFEYKTSILPDTEQMSKSYITEATIKMSLPAGVQPVTVVAYDENGTVLQSVQIASGSTATYWGAFTWGAALWGGTADRYRPRRIPWTEQPTFRMVQVGITGDSANDFHIGTLQTRYQFTGYLQQES